MLNPTVQIAELGFNLNIQNLKSPFCEVGMCAAAGHYEVEWAYKVKLGHIPKTQQPEKLTHTHVTPTSVVTPLPS